jgi:hypothetical protein
MTTALILATSIASSGLVFLISRRIGGFSNRRVAILAVAAFTIYAGFLFLRPDSWILINVVVLSVAGVGGSGLGLLIGSKASLITFCIVASIVDVYSVVQGATSTIVDSYREGSSDLLRYLAISVPVDGDITPIVGIGDFFVISAIYFVLARLGYQQMQVMLVPVAGLLLAVIVGMLVGGIFAIPFIAATTVFFVYLQAPVETSTRT